VLGATGIIVEYAGASLESGGAKPRLAFHRSFRFALSLLRSFASASNSRSALQVSTPTLLHLIEPNSPCFALKVTTCPPTTTESSAFPRMLPMLN
jgi:hypothetical protein